MLVRRTQAPSRLPTWYEGMPPRPVAPQSQTRDQQRVRKKKARTASPCNFVGVLVYWCAQAVNSASYNVNNQLTQWGGSAIGYDANGNMTSDSTKTYGWDARNHLASIGGGVIASFQYDAFGRSGF